MIYLQKDDYFEIHFNSMLSNYDRDTIALLYQPLIGASGAMLYFTLWSMQKIQKNFDIFSVENVLLPLTGMNLDQIQEARIKLEGTGLIQTFYKEGRNNNFFVIEIFAPKFPNDFINDPLFYGYFIKNLGEKNSQKIASIYKSKSVDKEGFIEISAKFQDAFNNVLSDLSNITPLNLEVDSSYGRVTKNITNNFDYVELLSILSKEKMISTKKFNAIVEQNIKSIATLYGIDVISMADYVAQSYSPEDEISPIDFNKIKKLAENDHSLYTLREKSNGDEQYDLSSQTGEKINLMASTPSLEFLKLKQNYKNPPSTDVKLLNELSEMGLSSGVINVIIDYCISVKDGKLIGNYCKKIAGSMNAKKINSVLDAMNYLQKGRNSYKNKYSNEAQNSETNSNETSDENKQEKTQEELDNFYDSLVD